MSGSVQSLRKDVERLLSSGKYLIRGDWEERIDLGESSVRYNSDHVL